MARPTGFHGTIDEIEKARRHGPLDARSDSTSLRFPAAAPGKAAGSVRPIEAGDLLVALGRRKNKSRQMTLLVRRPKKARVCRSAQILARAQSRPNAPCRLAILQTCGTNQPARPTP
jgi:hypothetical protein